MADEKQITAAVSAVALFIFATLSTIPTGEAPDFDSYLEGTTCEGMGYIFEEAKITSAEDVQKILDEYNCTIAEKAIKQYSVAGEEFKIVQTPSKLNLTKTILNETRLKLKDKDFEYEFGTNNRLKDGKILDAGILTLTKSAVVNPTQAFKYRKGQLKIHVEGNKSEVIIGDIYYLEEENYTYQRDITEFITEEKEYCYKNLNTTIDGLNGVGTKTCEKYNETRKIVVGTEEVQATRQIKKYDYWNKLIEANKDTIFYSDLRKTTPTDSFEVYFETFGYKDKEHSWWDSADYSQILNTSMQYGASDISSTLTDYVALVKLDTSNSTIFNTTSPVGLAFTHISDNSTRLKAELDSGWGTANTYIWVGNINQTSSSQIVAWADKNSDDEVDYNVSDMWKEADYYAVYHAEDAGQSTLIDSTGQNNLTESGSCTNTSRSMNIRIGGAIENDGTCYYGLSSGATGVPTGSGSSTETARVYPDATTSWCIAYAIGNADSQANDRFIYLDGKGGQTGYAGYGAEAAYLPRTTEVFNPYFLSTRYAGTTKIFGINTSYTTGTQSLSTSGAEIYVAGRWSTQYFDGVIDEIKFADVSRTDDWMKAEFGLFYNDTGDWIETSTDELNLSATLTPTDLAVNDTLNCTIQANSTANTSFTIDYEWYRNGVNLTEYAGTNSSYSNGTSWSIYLPLNSTINMESDVWQCRAYADDDTNTNQSNSSNVTTSYENALITTTETNIFNGSGSITSASTNYATLQSLLIENPFNFITPATTFSTFTSIAQGDLTAQFRLYDDTNNTALRTITRTMNENAWGSGALSSESYNIGALESINLIFEHRKVTSTPNDLTTANITTISRFFADSSTNETINYSSINFENSTTSATAVNIFEQNYEFEQRGYPVIQIDKVSLSSTADTRAGYLLEVDGVNCTTIYRNISSGGSGIGAAYCLGPNKVNASVPVNVKMFALTSAGTLTVNTSGTAHPHTTSESGQINLTGLSFNSSTFTSLINITESPLLEERDVLVLAAFSTNSTQGPINTSYKLRIYNSTDSIVNETVEMQRTLIANSEGIANLITEFSDLDFQTHTVELLAKNDQPSNITITGGSILAYTTTDTEAIQQNLTCGILGVRNREYKLTSNLTNDSTCFNVTALNVTLNCDGYTITGDNGTTDYGIFTEHNRTIVQNCIIQNFSKGILATGTNPDRLTALNNTINQTQAGAIRVVNGTKANITNNTAYANGNVFSIAQNNDTTIYNNTLQSEYDGMNGAVQAVIYINGGNNHNISLNTITSTSTATESEAGIGGFDTVSNITALNNTINLTGGSDTYAIRLTTNARNSIFYYNNISATKWITNLNSSNLFNTTGEGNIYYFSNGTASWDVYDIYDTTGNDWADAGDNYPFNSTLTEWTGSGTDNHPYTTNIDESPIIQSIVVSPNNPSILQNISCSVTAEDNRTSNIQIEYEIYKDGVNQTALAGTTNVTNDTKTDIYVIDSSLTDLNETWLCNARAFDGLNYSAFSNDSVTVRSDLIKNINLSSGISSVQFEPTYGYYDKRVAATNQTFSRSLFEVFQNATTTDTIEISVNQSVSGYTIYCDDEPFAYKPIVLNTTSQWILNASNGTTERIWCWANFSNPSTLNISIEVD